MSSILLLVFVLSSIAADLREPWPDAAAVAKAEKEVREIFANDISRAKSTGEKAKLAKEFLAFAEKVGDDPTQRLVLLLLAKDYAIEGRDKTIAMEATQAIVERYKAKIETTPQQLLEMGDKSLTAAKREQSTVKKIELQIEAFECYLWARQTATGLSRQLCEKKITDLMADAGEKKSGKNDDLKLLIGTWEVHIQGPNGSHDTKWTFYNDGGVDSTKGIKKGFWKAERKQITIVWNENSWETLNRPIVPSATTGDSKNFGPRSVLAVKYGKKDDLKLLIGTWDVKIGKRYTGVWTFYKNGTVLKDGRSTGKWTAGSEQIRIVWDSDQKWEVLNRPITVQTVVGESWDGENQVIATRSGQ